MVRLGGVGHGGVQGVRLQWSGFRKCHHSTASQPRGVPVKHASALVPGPSGDHGRLGELLESRAPAAVLLVPLAVGSAFLSDGIQEFLLAAALGVGRSEVIEVPSTEVMAPFVGVVEILGGALVLVMVGAGPWAVDPVLSWRGRVHP